MCGLMLAFVVAAGLWHRRRAGGVARIDFSMIEAMLWTMAEPLLATQLGAPAAAARQRFRPLLSRTASTAAPARTTGSHRRDQMTRNGEDFAPSSRPCRQWQGFGLGERVERRGAIDEALAAWCAAQAAEDGAGELLRAGIPAAALANSRRPRQQRAPEASAGFWEAHGAGVLPGLPWRASFGRTSGSRAGTRRGHRGRPPRGAERFIRGDRRAAQIRRARIADHHYRLLRPLDRGVDPTY